MNAPVGLPGIALLVWGVSIGLPWLGLAAAAVLEAARLLPLFDATRTRRATPIAVRLCVLLSLGWLGYTLFTQSVPHSLYTWLRWLPLILLPLPMLQLAARHPLQLGERDVDLVLAYAALALAAAGTGNAAQAWLYAAYVVLVGWGLLTLAPRGRLGAGLGMLAIAAALGYATHVGLATLQDLVDEWSQELIAELTSAKPDPLRERTRIGELGKIKLSDRIVMRVVPAGSRGPLLLREAAFDRYRNGEWHSARRSPRAAPNEGEAWRLSEGEAPARLSLRRSLPGGEGLLPLPPGTRSLERLPAQAVEVFPAGTVRVRGAPRFLAIDVAYDPAAGGEATASSDLEVPDTLSNVAAGVLDAERLRQATPSATLDAVRGFFAAKFAYSLDLGDARGGRGGGRTIGDFLLRDRKGHCEYFATATVLLLRQAGIPARYVGGYSAQEYSELERAFVVRARHAHAWAIAHVDGRWVEVDTTPARWAEFEAEAARGFFAPLLDRLSWLVDRAVLLWLGSSTEGLGELAARAAMILVLAGIALLAWRAGWRRLRARRGVSASDPAVEAWRSVERRLAVVGPARARQETAAEWARRFRAAHPEAGWSAALADLARDYYRVRFDPAATAAARERFVASARAFEERLAR